MRRIADPGGIFAIKSLVIGLVAVMLVISVWLLVRGLHWWIMWRREKAEKGTPKITINQALIGLSCAILPAGGWALTRFLCEYSYDWQIISIYLGFLAAFIGLGIWHVIEKRKLEWPTLPEGGEIIHGAGTAVSLGLSNVVSDLWKAVKLAIATIIGMSVWAYIAVSNQPLEALKLVLQWGALFVFYTVLISLPFSPLIFGESKGRHGCKTGSG